MKKREYIFDCDPFVVSQRKCIEVFLPKYEEISFLDEILDEINVVYESFVEAFLINSYLLLFLLPIFLFLFFFRCVFKGILYVFL